MPLWPLWRWMSLTPESVETKKTGPEPGFFMAISRFWRRSERHLECVQVFACFHQNQRAFVQDHRGWALAWHANGWGLGRNGGLHRSDFGAVRVNPHQTRVLRDLLQAVDGQRVAGHHRQGRAGCRSACRGGLSRADCCRRSSCWCRCRCRCRCRCSSRRGNRHLLAHGRCHCFGCGSRWLCIHRCRFLVDLRGYCSRCWR